MNQFDQDLLVYNIQMSGGKVEGVFIDYMV